MKFGFLAPGFACCEAPMLASVPAMELPRKPRRDKFVIDSSPSLRGAVFQKVIVAVPVRTGVLDGIEEGGVAQHARIAFLAQHLLHALAKLVPGGRVTWIFCQIRHAVWIPLDQI